MLMEEIRKLNNEMSSWNYGIFFNGKIITGDELDKFDWSKYRTIPIKTIEKYHIGVCWDYVNYQHYIFNKLKCPHKSYFFITQKGLDTNNITTHTFSIFYNNGNYYWSESSWKTHIGIHKISSFKDVIKELRSVYGKNNKYMVYEYNPSGLDKKLNSNEFF